MGRNTSNSNSFRGEGRKNEGWISKGNNLNQRSGNLYKVLVSESGKKSALGMASVGGDRRVYYAQLKNSPVRQNFRNEIFKK